MDLVDAMHITVSVFSTTTSLVCTQTSNVGLKNLHPKNRTPLVITTALFGEKGWGGCGSTRGNQGDSETEIVVPVIRLGQSAD